MAAVGVTYELLEDDDNNTGRVKWWIMAACSWNQNAFAPSERCPVYSAVPTGM